MSMDGSLDRVIVCRDKGEMVRRVNETILELPPELGRRLSKVVVGYIMEVEDLDLAVAKVHGRTARELIGELEKQTLPSPVISGERDGVKFTLYEGKDEK